ncbi:MAG: hypothetical protein U0992_10055 [Planctomycetaceae bacterium]
MITASKTDSRVVLGDGDYKYEVHHAWPQLPSQFQWQTTHNVAVDRDGNLYVIHEGKQDLPEHPAIFVFDKDGKYVRSFGAEFQGGGHGIEVRDEGEQFLYVCAYQQVKSFAKLSLKGEVVWRKHAPMPQSGVYAAEEDTNPQGLGPRLVHADELRFLDNGGFCWRTATAHFISTSMTRMATGNAASAVRQR